jgi:hypothetical protein
MEKLKRYERTFFAEKAIQDGFASLEKYVRANPEVGAELGEKKPALKVRLINPMIEKGVETYNYDSEEEFFADYRKEPNRVTYYKYIGSCKLGLHYHNKGTDVTVLCPTRQGIEAVFNRFEEYAPSSRLPEPPKAAKVVVPPKIFIGHGRNPLWRDLKDHLTEKHYYEVIAYEVGSRAGHTIRDILEDMLTKSSIAFLVLTGEDRDEDGKFHARENVIHETGLFQGRLGFSRGIIILEEGTEEFSNIQGIDQLRFSRGNIKEVFGDVVAVVKREFDNG